MVPFLHLPVFFCRRVRGPCGAVPPNVCVRDVAADSVRGTGPEPVPDDSLDAYRDHEHSAPIS